MKWSQLKKRFEETFADSVRGRVEVWATRYRNAHDQAGECWITFDKKQILNMADFTYYKQYYGEAQRIRELGNCQDYRNPEQEEGYYRAYEQALEHTQRNSVFESSDLKIAMAEYLNTGIDVVHASPRPILKAFSLLDRRFGKRRLLAFSPTNEHAMVQMLYEIRCQLEGVPSRSNNSLQTPPRP
jgi:hypothetical protein